MKPLHSSKRYRDFVTERNKALEFLADYYLSQLDDVLDELKLRVEQIAVHLHVAAHSDFINWEHALGGAFNTAISKAKAITLRMRRTTYMLAFVGEAEALARATGKPQSAKVDRQHLAKTLSRRSPSGGDMDKRIAFGFKQLMRKVIGAIEQSALGMDKPDPKVLVEDIDLAFPRKKKVRTPARKIQKPKRITEAKKPTDEGDSLLTGFIDDDAWNELVQDYKDANLPLRGPEDDVTIAAEGDITERYAWEVEQEITQDFIENVRDGQIESAKQNGIEEFLWIAIIDNRTDECCAWRDGLTTSEIRDELNGDHQDDECDTEVPPAHFNCRCDISPMTDDLLDEQSASDLGDFDTWLT